MQAFIHTPNLIILILILLKSWFTWYAEFTQKVCVHLKRYLHLTPCKNSHVWTISFLCDYIIIIIHSCIIVSHDLCSTVILTDVITKVSLMYTLKLLWYYVEQNSIQTLLILGTWHYYINNTGQSVTYYILLYNIHWLCDHLLYDLGTYIVSQL